MGVAFWPSKIRNRLNRLPWVPELITGRVCVSPHYPGVKVEPGTETLMDSGAFQDVADNQRLSFPAALDRQFKAEKQLGAPVRRIVTYDRLIDEKFVNGRQVKDRWGVAEAETAVDETIAAAQYLAGMREVLDGRQIVFGCQGVTVEQYARCAAAVLEVARPGECFGFGGFCIVGQRPRSKTADGITFLDQFGQVVTRVMPMIAARGMREAHLFGVTYRPALVLAVEAAKPYGIRLSCDSSAIEVRSAIVGGVWSETDGRFTEYLPRAAKWSHASEEVPEGFWHPNLLARENIGRATRSMEALGE